jgi:hypothetical protein
VAQEGESTPEARARERTESFTGLMWHIGTFVVINAFLWVLDIVVGVGGVQWAYWITFFWGIGLAFHVLAYLSATAGSKSGSTRNSLPRNRSARLTTHDDATVEHFRVPATQQRSLLAIEYVRESA